MEDEQQYKHFCRYCKKKFMCGRALGGHMRSHMTMPWTNDAEERHQRRRVVNGASEEVSVIIENHNQGGYGLRENPKKSRRFSDSVAPVGKDAKVRKDCGKAFPSMKVLFGHMRSHSERCSLSVDEGSCSEEQQQVNVLDGQCDNEAAPRRRSKRRARRPVSSSLGTNSLSLCSIEQEKEDVAISLMMLSRDVAGFWKGTTKENFQESSDNNSVSKDFRSGLEREPDLRNKKPVETDDGSIKKPRNGFFKTDFDAAKDNGGTGLASNESKKAKFDAYSGFHESRKNGLCVHEFHRESQHECKEMGYELSDSEMEKDSYIGGPESRRNGHKRARVDSSGNGFVKQLFRQARYECATCKKVFHSYQALGGHRASHKRVKGCFARIDNSENNSTETDGFPEQDNASTAEYKLKSSRIDDIIENGNAEDEIDNGFKKGKGHRCPICFKVFASGQALGGHKRSHMAPNGNQEIRDDACKTMVIQQQMPVIGDFLDLNLPAPNDDEGNGHSGFKSWWIDGHQKQNVLGKEGEAGLIAENAIASSKHADFHSVGPPPPPCLQV